MRCNSLLPLLLIAGFLGGCVRTIQPILNDDQVIADNSLVGKWSATDDKSFFEVEAADDQKVCKVTYTDKEGKIAPLIARLGKIGEITVAELRADEPAPDSSDVYKRTCSGCIRSLSSARPSRILSLRSWGRTGSRNTWPITRTICESPPRTETTWSSPPRRPIFRPSCCTISKTKEHFRKRQATSGRPLPRLSRRLIGSRNDRRIPEAIRRHSSPCDLQFKPAFGQ